MDLDLKVIECAAVCTTIGARRRRYIGTQPEYTVYSGELAEIILALDIARDIRNDYSPGTHYRLFVTTNQLYKVCEGPCQFLLQQILELHRTLGRSCSIHPSTSVDAPQ